MHAKFVCFRVITFEPDKIQKHAMYQNKHLNVIILEFPYNFFSKMAGCWLKLAIYDASLCIDSEIRPNTVLLRCYVWG